MSSGDPLTAGTTALAAGRWEEARTALAAAVDAAPSGAALAGLADAEWWLGEPVGAVDSRQRAYAAFCHGADLPSAVVEAVKLGIDYAACFENEAASSGWIGRAERLLDAADGDTGPLRGLVWVARSYTTPDAQQAVELGERALDLGRRLGDGDLELTALGQLGRALVEAGRVEEGMGLLDEAMAATLGGEPDDLALVVHTSCAMLRACDHTADLRRARQWCRAADAFTDTYGCPFLYAECRLLYGGVLLAAGDWAKAESELCEAVRAAEEHPALRGPSLARLAELRTYQGRWAEAEALVVEPEQPADTAVPAAAIHLGRGEPSAAIALCERRLAHHGGQRTDEAPTLALLVDAQLAAGDLDAAAAVATRMAREAVTRSDDRMGAEAARATGRVEEQREGREAALRCYEDALARFGRLELPLEEARARVDLARAAAAQPELAASQATTALTTFERLGARPDADACAALLRTLGVASGPGPQGPKGGGDLTRREREVLDLLAAGLSNPEIAARLFISRKTAAHHVSNVLAKLGLRNRTEAAAYATRRVGPERAEAGADGPGPDPHRAGGGR